MARLRQPSPPPSDHDYPHGPGPNGRGATLADTTSHHHEPAGLGRHQRHHTSSAETIPVPDYVYVRLYGWSTRLRPRKKMPASELQKGPDKNGPAKKSQVARKKRSKKSKSVQYSSKIERLFQNMDNAIQALKKETLKVSTQNKG